MKKGFSFVLILALLVTTAVFAQKDPGAEKLMELFTVEDSQVVDLFDESFLAQVPVQQLVLILKQYKSVLGDLIEVSGTSGNYTLIFSRGTAPSQIYLNDEGKIIGLWFGQWNLSPTDDDLSGLLEEFKALEGKVSVAVIRNNEEEVFLYNAEERLAVGSSFKLYVLKAVYEAVEKGELDFDTVVLLKEKDRSIPSGILQDWPAGTPVTVKTLTNLMISISDNTATDNLIGLVGREKVEGLANERNIPFLKTNELFKLKYAADSGLQEKYLKGSIEEKRDALPALADLKVNVSDIVTSPLLINELEWFFSTRELCSIIYELRDADELRINPGLADSEEWYLAAYKGGSEPGVLQYTHLLQKEAGGDFYAVSATINNPDKEVDQLKFTELCSRLITLIRDGKI